jgi:peptidoglycan/LPS O-acetylase OafA/YrhL
MWRTYQSDERVASALTSVTATQPAEASTAPARPPSAGDDRIPASFWYVSRWALAHIILGGVALLIALFLTIGRRPPEDPVRWMRLNFVILLVVIFLGSATRHFHVSLRERQYREGVAPPGAPPLFDDDDEDGAPASQPTTQSAA